MPDKIKFLSLEPSRTIDDQVTEYELSFNRNMYKRTMLVDVLSNGQLVNPHHMRPTDLRLGCKIDPEFELRLGENSITEKEKAYLALKINKLKE